MPEFDKIAPVYDETRRPPSEVELREVVSTLRPGWRVLEGGVGTGRYSGPLRDLGFHMTGVDISREMILRARGKGLDRLLLADLHRLPFRDETFDACLLVHVLQLIPDPIRALRELSRVARTRVVAAFPQRGGAEGPWRGQKVRQRYRELAAELGHPLPERVRYWENSKRLLELLPPQELRNLEVEVAASPDRERAWRDLRSFGGNIDVPPEVHERIVARLRQEFPPPDVPSTSRRRAMFIAVWDAAVVRGHPAVWG